MTQILYRFRCVECPYTKDVPRVADLPDECPMCGAEREKVSAVATRGGQQGHISQSRDLRH